MGKLGKQCRFRLRVAKSALHVCLLVANFADERGQTERKKDIQTDRETDRQRAVMSTNIQIFEYSNKMALKYYSYSYLCHLPSMNIFGYSFVDLWTTEYIQIFVCKFSKIRIYLNICSESYFNIQLSIFNEKSKSRYNLCIKNIQCKVLFRGNISHPFKKISSISDEYEYSNIQIIWPSNIIRIRICAISGIQIYSDIHSVNNVGTEYIRIFVRVHFMIFTHHWQRDIQTERQTLANWPKNRRKK